MEDEGELAGATADTLRSGWLGFAKHLGVVDSTNLEAARLMNSESRPALPALVVADRQTAGRGRSDHQWWSPSGCLMLTLVLDAKTLAVPVARIGELALVAGVAVSDAVRNLLGAPRNAAVELKWPNDLYVANRKCAGILIESGPGDSWLIGIGLNVAIDWTGAPVDVRAKATCLDEQLVRPVGSPAIGLGEVLLELLPCLQARLEAWSEGSFAWREDWQRRCLLTGKHVVAKGADEREVAGRCLGIDEQGRLLLQTRTRGLVAFASGEIQSWHAP